MDFPAALLNHASTGHNGALQPLLLGELTQQMALLQPPAHRREQVLTLIRRQLWSGEADPRTLLAGICETLKLTRWTLNRHLREEGCHFSALLEQVGREAACRLLQDPALPLQEVGGRLGFASQSSFTRFFKEAFDQSPSQYRAIATGTEMAAPLASLTRPPEGGSRGPGPSPLPLGRVGRGCASSQR